MDDQSERMMHWSCRLCPREWSETIVKIGKSNRAFGDAHQETICDTCLDGMGPSTAKDKEVQC